MHFFVEFDFLFWFFPLLSAQDLVGWVRWSCILYDGIQYIAPARDAGIQCLVPDLADGIVRFGCDSSFLAAPAWPPSPGVHWRQNKHHGFIMDHNYAGINEAAKRPAFEVQFTLPQ